MTEHNSITTADGIPIGDNQNSLTAGDLASQITYNYPSANID
jgi:catalase